MDFDDPYDCNKWVVDMPRVYITKEDEQLNKIYRFILGECSMQGIKQKDIAEVLDVTQQAVSVMLRKRTLSLEQMLKVMNLLGKDLLKCIE